MPRHLITFSTIPQRVKNIDSTLASLCTQLGHGDAIKIYIPLIVKRLNKEISNNDIKAIAEIEKKYPRVSVQYIDEDLGPLTKMAYAVRDPIIRNNFDRVIFVDDDQVYDKNFLERFNKHYYLDKTCLTQSGTWLNRYTPYSRRTLNPYGRPPRFKGFSYRIRRLARLFFVSKPSPWVKGGFIDLLEGWSGVSVDPNWFDDEILNIPEDISRADDVWISGYLESRKIGIYVIPNCILALDNGSSEISSLKGEVEKNSVESVYSRAVEHCRSRWNIW